MMYLQCKNNNQKRNFQALEDLKLMRQSKKFIALIFTPDIICLSFGYFCHKFNQNKKQP